MTPSIFDDSIACAKDGGRPRFRLFAYAMAALEDKDEAEDEPDTRFMTRELLRESFFSRCFSAACIAATMAGSRRGSFKFGGLLSGMADKFGTLGDALRPCGG